MQQITAHVAEGHVLVSAEVTHLRFGPLLLTMPTEAAQRLASDIIANMIIDKALTDAGAEHDAALEVEAVRAALLTQFRGGTA